MQWSNRRETAKAKQRDKEGMQPFFAILILTSYVLISTIRASTFSEAPRYGLKLVCIRAPKTQTKSPTEYCSTEPLVRATSAPVMMSRRAVTTSSQNHTFNNNTPP